MGSLYHITDEEFVPFLHSLGVETYNKSFEWMHETEFSDVLLWLYNNLDHNNAQTAREECRYAELEKKGALLSSEDLETTLKSIQQQYNGICLPGDRDGLEDVKVDISMQKERLNVLKNHENVLKNVARQNELINESLTAELTKLNSAQQQCCEDENSAAEECLGLAEELETITEGVVDVIADTIELYANCHVDKETAKKFLTFGPLEAYRQTQALYKSHFDLYATRKFGKRHNEGVAVDDLRAALVEAKSLEDRVSDALCAYVESSAELQGEQAKLALVTNYTAVHPSQVTALAMEAQTAVDLLNQEELILDQQIQDAIKELTTSRTRLVMDTSTKSALAVREQIHTDLAHLLDTSQQALALDRLLYCALRHELGTVEQRTHFAAQLRQYALSERAAVADRVDSMTQITSEQELCERKLQSSDTLLSALCAMFRVEPGTDAMLPARLYSDLQTKLRELDCDVMDGYRRKEGVLREFQRSLQPLRSAIFTGSTKQPNCRDSALQALSHSLRQELEGAESGVQEIGSLFAAARNGDKHNLRKLWQWFLTDPTRLLAAVRGASAR